MTKIDATHYGANNRRMTKHDAIAWAGGTQALLAEKLGVTQGSVSLWGDRIPPLRQLQLERLSGGELKAGPECDDFRVPVSSPAA